MNIEEILKLIKQGESETIEFKKDLSNTIAKSVCAFANSSGGIIIIGVDDNGNIYGISDEERLYNIISSVTPYPNIEIEKLFINEKKVIVLKIKKSTKLHSYNGIVYVRVGNINRPLSVNEILERAAESVMLSFDLIPNREAKIDDLDEKILKKIIRKKKISKEDLEKANLITPEGVLNGTILLFGKNPQQFFEYAYIDFVDEIKNERISISGALWKQVEDAFDLLTKSLKEKIIVKGTKRVLLPTRAFREAIVNAIVHRNYFVNSPIVIKIKESVIEITNPGSFPPGVSVEHPRHVARNPLISKFMYRLGYGERLGKGIELIISDANAKNFSVQYIPSENFTSLIFSQKISTKNVVEEMILSLIKEKNELTAMEIAKELKLSKRTILYYLKRLIKQNKIIKIGSGKNTKYKLK